MVGNIVALLLVEHFKRISRGQRLEHRSYRLTGLL